jgi:hypothetical protein
MFVTDDPGVLETLFDLVSNQNQIAFLGHGSSTRFSTHDHGVYFSVGDIASVDLQSRHPVVFGYSPCSAADLTSSESFSTEFMRAGAASYVAKTTDNGLPYYFGATFQEVVRGGLMKPYRMGDALFDMTREAVLAHGENRDDQYCERLVGGLNLYGDPTLKRRAWDWEVLPTMEAVGALIPTSSQNSVMVLDTGGHF